MIEVETASLFASAIDNAITLIAREIGRKKVDVIDEFMAASLNRKRSAYYVLVSADQTALPPRADRISILAALNSYGVLSHAQLKALADLGGITPVALETSQESGPPHKLLVIPESSPVVTTHLRRLTAVVVVGLVFIFAVLLTLASRMYGLTQSVSPSEIPTAAGLTQRRVHAITATIIGNNYDAAEDVWRGFRVGGDELRHDWVGPDDRTKSGWIFASLPIPARASIRSAFVRFRGWGNGHGTAYIFSTNEISAEPFAANGSNRITVRKRANQQVFWSGNWATNYAWIETPDLTPIFQELVNRNGWREGNNIAIFLEGGLPNGANFCIVDFSEGPLDIYRTNEGHATTLFLEYTDP